MDTEPEIRARATAHIAIARNYIDLHMADDIELWRIEDWYRNDERFLAVYNNMRLGRYGINGYSNNQFRLTIPARESKTGDLVEFNYD